MDAAGGGAGVVYWIGGAGCLIDAAAAEETDPCLLVSSSLQCVRYWTGAGVGLGASNR